MKPLSQLALYALLSTGATAAHAATVFDGGTIFISSTIITKDSPSAFSNLTYKGTGQRETFDRRLNNWVTQESYLFDVNFGDGLVSEAIVNMEFGSVDAALDRALYYSKAIGQLPAALRTDIKGIWIHDGVEPFGGGNDSVLIHDGQSVLYNDRGWLEETLVHEATHTSLDAALAQSVGWVAAQQADNKFISPYAEEFPDREDLAETFLMWLALRHKPESLTEQQRAAIEAGIPNRLAFLDAQNFNLFPFLSPAAVPEPATWAMMIAGFGLVGAAMRRRQRVSVRYA